MQNQTQSPLLRLPAELRNSVYTYALGGHRISIGAPYSLDPGEMTVIESDDCQYPASALLGLTLACRQTHAETRDQVFELNEFGGRYNKEHHSFAKTVDRFEECFTMDQRNAIKRVWIKFGDLERFENTELEQILDSRQWILEILLHRIPGLEMVVLRFES